MEAAAPLRIEETISAVVQQVGQGLPPVEPVIPDDDNQPMDAEEPRPAMPQDQRAADDDQPRKLPSNFRKDKLEFRGHVYTQNRTVKHKVHASYLAFY